MGIAVIMRPDDWRMATTDSFHCEHGSAYGVCMELLLMLASVTVGKDGNKPKRVSVFLKGRKNTRDAILRASLYKEATEPVEVPPGVVLQKLWENPLRTGLHTDWLYRPSPLGDPRLCRGGSKSLTAPAVRGT